MAPESRDFGKELEQSCLLAGHEDRGRPVQPVQELQPGRCPGRGGHEGPPEVKPEPGLPAGLRQPGRPDPPERPRPRIEPDRPGLRRADGRPAGPVGRQPASRCSPHLTVLRDQPAEHFVWTICLHAPVSGRPTVRSRPRAVWICSRRRPFHVLTCSEHMRTILPGAHCVEVGGPDERDEADRGCGGG